MPFDLSRLSVRGDLHFYLLDRHADSLETPLLPNSVLILPAYHAKRTCKGQAASKLLPPGGVGGGGGALDSVAFFLLGPKRGPALNTGTTRLVENCLPDPGDTT